MSTSHTPGPWGISSQSARIIKQYDSLGETNVIIGSASGYPKSGFYPSDEVAFENARLICAAPDLLEELESIYTWLADYTHEWTGRSTQEGQARLCRMRDAIAKATGRNEEEVQDDYGTRAAIAKATGAE